MEWKTLNPMPTKRMYSTLTECRGSLYAVGGCDPRGMPIDVFESYDYSKKKWLRRFCLKTKRAAPGVVAIENHIVVVGGIGADQMPVKTVEVYDAEKCAWTEGSSLKDGLNGMSCLAKDNKVLIVGGSDSQTNPVGELLSYDVITNQWSKLSDMPTPRYASTSFLINDKLYVIGGRQGKVPSVALEVYDFGSDKWKKLPDIPSKRVFAMYVHDNSRIYSIGGLNIETGVQQMTDTMEIFDLVSEKWSTENSMKTKRGDFAAAVINGKIVAAGGLGGDGKPLADVESFDPLSRVWLSEPNLPFPMCSASFFSTSLGLFLLGGISTTGVCANFVLCH